MSTRDYDEKCSRDVKETSVFYWVQAQRLNALRTGDTGNKGHFPPIGHKKEGM